MRLNSTTYIQQLFLVSINELLLSFGYVRNKHLPGL